MDSVKNVGNYLFLFLPYEIKFMHANRSIRIFHLFRVSWKVAHHFASGCRVVEVNKNIWVMEWIRILRNPMTMLKSLNFRFYYIIEVLICCHHLADVKKNTSRNVCAQSISQKQFYVKGTTPANMMWPLECELKVSWGFMRLIQYSRCWRCIIHLLSMVYEN